jgi:hypothetical protein
MIGVGIMKIIREKLNEVVMEFNNKENKDEEFVIDIHNRLEKLLISFVKRNMKDLNAIKQAYFDYLSLYVEGDLRDSLDKYSLELDFLEVFNHVDSDNVDAVNSLALAKLRVNGHSAGLKMRRAAESYYCNSDCQEEEVVLNAVEELADILKSSIKEFYDFKVWLIYKFSTSVEEYELNLEIERVYDAFFYFCHEFGINATLKKYEREVDLEVITEPLEDKSLIASLDKTRDIYVHGFPGDVMGRMVESLISFSDYMDTLLAGEIQNRLRDVMSHYFDKNYFQGNMNYLVILFGGIVYLNKKLQANWKKYFSPSSMEFIYDRIPDQEFKSYLKLIEEEKWEEAINFSENSSDYELPYYYIFLNSLSRIKDVNDIFELPLEYVTETILKSKNSLVDLYFEAIGTATCSYLPSIYDISNYLTQDNVELAVRILEYSLKVAETHTRELNQKNAELTELNLRLRKLTSKNNRMVDDFSHSYSNIIKPELVFNVARSIYEDSRFKNEYEDLIRAYNNEMMATNECEMLKLTHLDDSEESKLRVQDYIRDGIALDGGFGITHIINYALERTLIRVLFENRPRAKSIRKGMANLGVDVDELSRSFKYSVLSYPTGESTSINWFNNQSGLFKININSDDNWSRLRLVENSGASTFLITRFMELLFNAFTYADKGSDSFFNIELSLQKIGFYNYLLIKFQNPVEPNGFMGGGKRGLKATEEILNILNYDSLEKSSNYKYLETGCSSNLFTSKLYINRDLLI